ncbi:MAG: DUF92 domain-containing protein [Gemmatimonadales bacterium]|nr:DUF92 domain-containing protein [Gemmatimonadales bacterium]
MAPPPVPVAALASALVAAAGWRAGALTAAGAVAASAVGLAIVVGAGWSGGAILLAFFTLTSAVSRRAARRRAPALDTRGERRDHWQVLANGGFPALGALAAAGSPAVIWLVTGGLATAAADTWATSWGASSATLPRHVLSGRVVPTGTSGGITARGTTGALAGALVTAAAGVPWSGWPVLLGGTIVGLAGMFLDSLLGAAVQGRFHCTACDEPCEWPRHRCGARSRHVGGWRWLDNDGVNALATAAGTGAGWFAYRLLSGA